MPDSPFVLLVEDDPTNRMLATRILTSAGIQYVEATDGQQALAQLALRRPDLVLMDLSLPVIDGWEVTRRIRLDPSLQGLPVLAVSAHAMSGDRERAIAAGCDDYLAKPYRPAELIAAIARFTTIPGRVSATPANQTRQAMTSSVMEPRR